MRELSTSAFAGRLREMLDEPDCKLVWFLGAGCSISSGIPGAAALVDRWLPRLKKRETGSDESWQKWATSRFPTYDRDDAGLIYGGVMDELFPLPRERQQEVESITSDRDPSVGYALLSVLAAHEEFGPKANIFLTTNFDDLVADSLYLLTRKKPLVVAHESLAAFARASRRRPLVVKVHGDARLAPRNTIDETHELDVALASRVTTLLSGCALIFCGYAGNDVSVSRLLTQAPSDSFPQGIYWVGSTVPAGAVGDWLRERPECFHVKHRDFDALLIQIAGRLDLSLPGVDRFSDLFDGWNKALQQKEIGTASSQEPELGRAASKLRRGLGGLRAATRARGLEASDPQGALAAYEEAVKEEPVQAIVFQMFAGFLADKRMDLERADEMYRRALDADADDVSILNRYAMFLAVHQRSPVRAEAMFERALVADPDNAETLRLYASVLGGYRRDLDRAEAMFERALVADPDNAYTLGSYAAFLGRARRDFDRAEEMFERALVADPDNAYTLRNYAAFVAKYQRDLGRAEEMFERILSADPDPDADNSRARGNFAQLLFARGSDDRAESIVRSLLARQGVESSLRVELLFYLAAHVPEDDSIGPALRHAINSGVRSIGASFRIDLDRIGIESDGRLEFLECLAAVVCDERQPDSLERFNVWRSWADTGLKE